MITKICIKQRFFRKILIIVYKCLALTEDNKSHFKLKKRGFRSAIIYSTGVPCP